MKKYLLLMLLVAAGAAALSAGPTAINSPAAAPTGSYVAPPADPERDAPTGRADTSTTTPDELGSTQRAAEFREVTIPAGTVLPLTLDSSVASDRSSVEDPVRAHIRRSIVIRGVRAIPAGSAVGGSVIDAKRSAKVKGRARIGFRFHTLNVSGESYRIETSRVARQAPGTKKKDAAKIGIPAAGGAIVGGIIGGKKGAAIGAAAGGGGGTAVVLSTRGKEVRLPRGSMVSVRLLQPITVRIPIG